MMEQTIMIKIFEEVEVDPTLKNVLGRYKQKDAAFTEEEMSTLKTIVSNFNSIHEGTLKVYDLIDYREVFVDPDFSSSEVEMIIDNNGDSDARTTRDNFADWMQENHNDLYVEFLNNNWNLIFHNAFVWSDHDCVQELIDWLVDVKNFSVVKVEYMPYIRDTFLDKNSANKWFNGTRYRYHEKAEIKERTIRDRGTRLLYKLLSLLNL